MFLGKGCDLPSIVIEWRRQTGALIALIGRIRLHGFGRSWLWSTLVVLSGVVLYRTNCIFRRFTGAVSGNRGTCGAACVRDEPVLDFTVLFAVRHYVLLL